MSGPGGARRISKASFVPDKNASPKRQKTQRNNLERISRVLEGASERSVARGVASYLPTRPRDGADQYR
jgi:hypothetical protein